MSTSTSSSNSDSVPEQIANALNQSSQADIVKVGIALGTFLALALATLVGFEILRPKNKIVYEPKRKYAEIDGPAPPKLAYSIFGWIKPVWSYTEEDLLGIVGLDAVTFLRFIRMCCIITTALSVLLGATLFPVCLVYNLRSERAAQYTQKATALSVITIAEMTGDYLWAPIIMSYFAVIVALYFSK
jgi:hypothetical protein